MWHRPLYRALICSFVFYYLNLNFRNQGTHRSNCKICFCLTDTMSHGYNMKQALVVLWVKLAGRGSDSSLPAGVAVVPAQHPQRKHVWNAQFPLQHTHTLFLAACVQSPHPVRLWYLDIMVPGGVHDLKRQQCVVEYEWRVHNSGIRVCSRARASQEAVLQSLGRAGQPSLLSDCKSRAG